MNPTVTIIMATYNRAHFIVETLESIQNQTFQEWECLIIDDGGTDNTLEVISSIIDSDKRFKFSKRPSPYKKGLPGCRNYGLDEAKGDFIIFFDDDDYIHPENLKISLEVIKSKKVDFCHYQKKAYSDKRPEVKNYPIAFQSSLSIDNIESIVTHKIGLASCTVLWNKRCFKKIRFNENLLYAEEWECYSKIISEGFEGVVINNVLYYNRKHANSNTGEFYTHNPIRRESKKEAILLVVKNLVEKELLTSSILNYFIKVSWQFKEYSLFDSIMKLVGYRGIKKFESIFFYYKNALRTTLYKFRKKHLKTS